MKYLLTAILIGLFAWPYYYRFKSFKEWNPIPLALVHAVPIALGLTLILQAAAGPLPLVDIFDYDPVSMVTFGLICSVITVWNVYLTLSSGVGTDINDTDAALGLFAISCVISLIPGVASAYSIVELVLAITGE